MLAAARPGTTVADIAGKLVLSEGTVRNSCRPAARSRPYPARGEYPPVSMSSMSTGPTGTQPRSSRVTVLVAARSMAQKVPIHPK